MASQGVHSMNKRNKNLMQAVIAVNAFVTFPSAGLAAGFALIEQSVSGLGNSFAGASSISEDATTVYFNPAGMTQLSGNSFSFALHAVTPSAKFTDENSTASGGNGGDAGATETVPNIYFVTDISEKTKFGIGINAPFGLSTEYEADWVGRYHAVKSELMSLNINPAIAFEINKAWSFGFGANFMYIDADLTNALNFSALGLEDGFSSITGDSLGVGYNFGVLFAPTQDAKLGFSYRSKVKHKLEGRADFTLPSGADSIPTVPLPTIFADTNAWANVNLPESYAFSGYTKLSNRWALMGEITHTRWSRYQELVIETENPFLPAIVDENKWKNSYRYAVGANYMPNEQFTARVGFAFDEGAAPNAEYRSPRVPDHDRTWISLGMGYKHNAMSFDFAYAHLFIDDAYINRSATTAFASDLLNGKYELSVDIISAQFNYVF
jgi:long-chain fatty acid transport protein